VVLFFATPIVARNYGLQDCTASLTSAIHHKHGQSLDFQFYMHREGLWMGLGSVLHWRSTGILQFGFLGSTMIIQRRKITKLVVPGTMLICHLSNDIKSLYKTAPLVHTVLMHRLNNGILSFAFLANIHCIVEDRPLRPHTRRSSHFSRQAPLIRISRCPSSNISTAACPVHSKPTCNGNKNSHPL
jgi:hypothetical protein